MSAVLDQEPEGSERRVAQRVRTLKPGKILFNNRFSTFDCTVRNVSSTGALLTIDAAAHIPKTFDVRIGDDPERPAKLVYRRGQLAGIRFLDVVLEEEEQAAHDQVSKPSISTAGTISRFKPEELPQAITHRFPWR